MDQTALSVDSRLTQMQSDAAELSRPKLAALFAVCGRALIPLYEEFSRRFQWGDPRVLDSAVSVAFDFASGATVPHETLTRLRKQIEALIPDGERFDAPSSTFAQDVAICLDAALRAADPQQEIDASWVEYVLEPAMIMAAEEQTGYIDPGSEWRETALQHQALRRAFDSMATLIKTIADSPLINEDSLVECGRVANGLLPSRVGN